jgi:hypothetical protein
MSITIAITGLARFILEVTAERACSEKQRVGPYIAEIYVAEKTGKEGTDIVAVSPSVNKLKDTFFD